MKFKLRIIKDESLEEGRREKDWIKLQPKEEQVEWEFIELDGVKLSDMAWIKARRGDKEIAEVAEYVVKFREDSVQKKLKDNGYDTNLSKKNPKHTFEYLKNLIDMIDQASESDKQYDEIIKDPSQVEFLGKVGNWEVLMPKTQRGSISCDISGEDTTWCTTKKDGQNLFYSYVGRTITDITLFYVMDYTRTPKMGKGKSGEILCIKDCDARLAIGWDQNGMRLDGQRGGLSVNAGNEGLKMKIKKIGRIDGDNPKATVDKQRSILEIFDSSEWKQIEQLMNDAWESIDKGRLHPAKEMLKKAAGNLILLKQLTKDYKKEEKKDFFKMILDQESISQDVEMFLIDQDVDMAIAVARYTPHSETLVKAYKAWKKYDSTDLVYHVLFRSETPASIFKEVAKDEVLLKNKNIQTRMASDKRSPPEVFLKLLELTFDKQTINRIGRNPYATPEVIEAVIMHDQAGPLVWRSLLTDRSDDIPMKALEYLANLDEFPPRTSKIAKKVLAARQGQLEEVSAMSGGAVQGHANPRKDDELKEMYSSTALTGRNYRIKICGKKEQAGHVERSQQQGLRNVMEDDDATFDLGDDSFEDTFSDSEVNTSSALSSAPSGPMDVDDIIEDQSKKKGIELKSVLGRGQYGRVYLGEYVDSDLECAVKIVGLGRSKNIPKNMIDQEIGNYNKVSKARENNEDIWTHFPEVYDSWIYDDEDGLGFYLGFIVMEKLKPATEEQNAFIPDLYSWLARRNPMDIEDIELHYKEKKDLTKRATYWARDLDYVTRVFDMYDDLMRRNEPIDDSDKEEYDKILTTVSKSSLKRYERMADRDPEKIKALIKDRMQKLGYWATNFEWLDGRDILDKDLGPDSYIKLIWADLIYALARVGYFTNTPEREINQMIKEMSAEVINGYRKTTGFPTSFKSGGELSKDKKDRDSQFAPAQDLYNAMRELYKQTGLLSKDVHDGNVMVRDGSNDLVIVDLGLFKQLRKPTKLSVKESRKYRIKLLTKR
jgi:serine/threonine protein kinase